MSESGELEPADKAMQELGPLPPETMEQIDICFKEFVFMLIAKFKHEATRRGDGVITPSDVSNAYREIVGRHAKSAKRERLVNIGFTLGGAFTSLGIATIKGNAVLGFTILSAGIAFMAISFAWKFTD